MSINKGPNTSAHRYSHLTFDKGQNTYTVGDTASSTNIFGNTEYSHAEELNETLIHYHVQKLDTSVSKPSF